MIKLSDRLQRIADEIKEGETMADIGTDHGFLPVFLAESGRCPYVIMTDVSILSLDKARNTAKERVNKEKGSISAMDFRVGDGLSVLKSAEVNSVVIAGMGGKLIRDIMAADMALTRSMDKFIMQPRIGQGHLRKWLIDNGFIIIREGVVYEGRHIPEIITAVSSGKDLEQGEHLIKRAEGDMPAIIDEMMASDEEDIRWRIPPWLIYADGPVGEFLLRNEAGEREKLDNVQRAKARDLEFEQKILHNIEYLMKLQELHRLQKI